MSILITLAVIVVLVVAVAFFVIAIYNKLVTLRNRYKNAMRRLTCS